MSVSYWQNTVEQKDKKHYDAVIVGAGIAGVSVAYWLNKISPNLKIALVDKYEMGAGASGRNAGFVTCGSLEHLMKLEVQWGMEKALEIWKFSEANHELLQIELLNSTTSIPYKVTGSCTVAPSAERLEDYKSFAQKAKSHGLDIKILSSEAIENEFSLKGFFGGALYDKDGEVHPLHMLRALFKNCKVDYYPQEEVFQYSEVSQHIQLRTQRETFSSDALFVTTNADLPVLFPEFRQLVQPGRGQILTTEPVPFRVKGPCYFTQDLCYFRQLPDQRLLVGGFRNLDTAGETTSLDLITDTIQSALLNFVKTRFQNSQNIKISHQWSGTMAFTKDNQPLVGQHPHRKRVYIHAGCSGHGMGNNFHIAKVLAENYSGKKLPSFMDIDRFRSEIKE